MSPISVSLTPSLSLYLCRCPTFPLSHARSLMHSIFHAHTLSHTLSLSCILALPLPLPLFCCPCIVTLSFCLSLSRTNRPTDPLLWLSSFSFTEKAAAGAKKQQQLAAASAAAVAEKEKKDQAAAAVVRKL